MRSARYHGSMKAGFSLAAAVFILAAPTLGWSANAAPPTVTIVSPQHCLCGQTRVNSTVTFVMSVVNLAISPANIGAKPVPGHGYLAFSVDGGKFDTPAYSSAGKLAVKLGVSGKYSPSGVPKLTYHDLPTGTHTLVVFLVRNDGKKIAGASARTVVTFIVQ